MGSGGLHVCGDRRMRRWPTIRTPTFSDTDLKGEEESGVIMVSTRDRERVGVVWDVHLGQPRLRLARRRHLRDAS